MKHSPGFEKLCTAALQSVAEISVAEAARLSTEPGYVLIDVREESEWRAGHAAHAIHLGKGVIERDIEARFPDPSLHLLLYCGGGYRSALAALNIAKMGYGNVHSVAGGWRAWLAAGLPCEGQPER